MDTCVATALAQAGITAQDLDAVAVSIGPGLSPCLHVSKQHGHMVLKQSHAGSQVTICIGMTC